MKLFCVAAPVAVAAESVQPVIATSTAIPAEKGAAVPKISIRTDPDNRYPALLHVIPM